MRTYNLFKFSKGKESYLNFIKNSQVRSAFAKFRTSSHKLKIETGRYDRKWNPIEMCFKNTPPQERKCDKCDSGEVENELHFLIKCNNYKYQRQLLFEVALRNCTNFNYLSDDNKFIWLMSNENKDTIISVADFIFNCMKICG